MFKFLKELQAQLEGIPSAQIVEPGIELKDGEIVIATLTDVNLRKLFTLRNRLMDEVDCLLKQGINNMLEAILAGGEHDSETCPSCRAALKISHLKDRARAIDRLMRAGIQAELTEAQVAQADKGDGIALRKGWQIVAMPKEEEHSPEDVLNQLFGMPVGIYQVVVPRRR